MSTNRSSARLPNEARPARSDDTVYEDRHSLLASAVAGRRVTVTVGGDELAYSDGETIFVPSGSADAVGRAVIAQAALIGAGSLDPLTIVELQAAAAASRRYVTLEMSRALADPTIPIPRRTRDELRLPDLSSASASASVQRAIVDEDVPPAPSEIGTVRAKAVIKASGAAAFGRRLTPQQQRTAGDADVEELGDDEDTEESKVMKKLRGGPKLENPFLRLLRKQLGMGSRTKADDGSGGDDMKVGAMRSVDRVGAHAVALAAPPSVQLRVDGHRVGGRLYPEWDGLAHEYRPEYCAVAEFAPGDEPDDSHDHRRPDTELRRRLASLGLVHQRHRRLADGDDLDVNALVEAAVVAATGATPDDRVYEARRKTGRDLSVLVLLDASGSTAQERDGKTVWNNHRHVAADLASALEAVGDRVAIFGFNSRGRKHVRFLGVKDFDHRFDGAARRRLGSLRPGGYTRLGASIRHATHLIEHDGGTNHRVIVVVSDGFAYDDGYEGRYAELDTRRALEEASQKGIGCVCVSVATETRPDVLDRLWGDASHVRLNDASELAPHAVPLIEAAVHRALGAQRVVG